MRAPVSEVIVAALERGATVVTANERAARGVRRGWDELKRDRGLRAWETARALSVRSWLRMLFQGLAVGGADDRMLLHGAQEHRVWRGVLLEDAETEGLTDLDALAELCCAAYGRLCAYRGLERLEGMRGLGADAAAFARWARMFGQRCAEERLLPERALAGELAGAIARGSLPVAGEEIALLGFDELTPELARLVAAWRDGGGRALVLEAGDAAGRGAVVEATDLAEEVRGFARWARARLEREPETRVALVVEDLARERDGIETVLRETLAPELEDIRRDATGVPFEFSLGGSLAREPLVTAALAMLGWLRRPMALGQVERLLQGPGLRSHAEERAARGAAVRALYRETRLEPEATIDDVLRLAESKRVPVAKLAGLRRGLAGLRRAAGEVEQEAWRGFAAWADFVRGVLAGAQWAHGLSSRGYQVVERWEGVLDTLSSLDFRGETVEWEEVLAELARLSEETIFAPERRETPVQVLGPREAAGSVFDAVWVLRAGEMQWPAGTGESALLPRALGRELGLPGSDRVVERRRSEAMTRRLAASAPEVIFSYAAYSADGVERRAAAEVLALGWPTRAMEEVAPAAVKREVVALERVEDAERISPLPRRAVRGGSRVLELQAICGFRAFAELRLGADEMEREVFGLSPGRRGEVVHTALEVFWKRLKSQEALRALPEAERWAVLEVAIDAALKRVLGVARGTWGQSYLEVERERLRRLLRTWLRKEMERPAFVVAQQEQTEHALAVGPLDLSIRVDRVDVVEGARVLLDYKTGAAETRQWKGERPDKPQVPLYAVMASKAAAETEPLGAVAFARVVPGKDMGVEGFAWEGATLLEKTAKMEAPSFAEQVERWAEIVEQLATEFASGEAGVRPKSFPKSCEHCGQRLLCRVDPAAFEEMEAEDDAEDGPVRND